MKTALITGITGQDGAHLAKFLLEKGYRVVGFFPRRSSNTHWRLDYLKITDKIDYTEGDVTDFASLARTIKETSPRSISHIAST
jgi:GDPmannose 4,6-dehydratase